MLSVGRSVRSVLICGVLCTLPFAANAGGLYYKAPDFVPVSSAPYITYRWPNMGYPWCVYDPAGATNCGFTTYEQCMVTLSGIGGFCNRNAQYVPPLGPEGPAVYSRQYRNPRSSGTRRAEPRRPPAFSTARRVARVRFPWIRRH